MSKLADRAHPTLLPPRHTRGHQALAAASRAGGWQQRSRRWWQPVCDGYVMDVSSSCGKRTVSACSTSARHLRDDHTSCGFLHLCLHALFLLYLNNEMLRASVSVVGWSVLSLLDVTVKMQLLLLFNSVPSLLSFFYLQPFWRWLYGIYIFTVWG